ncbi:MAG: hypothetical protein LBG52_02250, partial [Candidatus Peribacteria bacterium]|nr:hypothetical protein [Candidatus Peribacteria bacterium]
VNKEYTFAWSDEGEFAVTKGHVFAVKAKSGVVVSTDTPNEIVALTVSGDLRIQPNGGDTSGCNATTQGTMKSVMTGGQLCSCFCDGAAWQTVLDTPQCVKACKDPRVNLQYICTT